MKKILIVDDTEINRILLKRYLGTENFILIEATNGLEAVETSTKENLDLVFMDIMMPYMNGIEATIEIKKIKPELPIIAVSAYLDDELQNLKIFDIKLTKPINFNMINGVLDKFLI